MPQYIADVSDGEQCVLVEGVLDVQVPLLSGLIFESLGNGVARVARCRRAHQVLDEDRVCNRDSMRLEYEVGCVEQGELQVVVEDWSVVDSVPSANDRVFERAPG